MSASPHAHEHHPASAIGLLATFIALVLLTLLTSFLGQPWIDLGRADIFVTLGIATLKAALVALFFMHLLHDKAFNGIILISTLLFTALFVCFTLMDTRQYENRIDAETTQKTQEAEKLK